jgi:glycerol uptake facilitator-like aquaporin
MQQLGMTVTTPFDYFREALSEFMATAAFVFLMCGTGLSTRNPTNQFGIDLTAHFAVSLANGLAASFVIYAFGNVRFAHVRW